MEKELAAAAAAGTSIEQLPNNILVDILSRLPIKSVIRCRCVCKSFLSAISLDPEFPPLHLSRSPPELMLCPPLTDKLILYDSDNDRAHKLNLRFDRPPGLEVVNSSRGLLCLRLPNAGPVCVFNPSSLEFTLIPDTVIEREKHILMTIGFGYSSTSNTYKVLRTLLLLQQSDIINVGRRCLTDIYTLGTPRWRRIEEDAPMVVFRDFFPTFLNGSLHWIIDENLSRSTTYDYMISFDFDNERFGEIALPPPFDTGKERHSAPVLGVGVFEGQLSVCLWNLFNRVDVWVMKKYGVRESWSREIVLRTTLLYWPEGSFPVKYMSADDVLFFKADYSLITYNLLENKIVKCIKFNGLPPEYDNEAKALIHVPILMSLKELVVGAEVHLLTGRWKAWKRWKDLTVSDNSPDSL
ncbi:F-box/kelch-repeat protein At3g06240-like [Impatiens glandulifera]|uniref:F-box/kelch-repeat protein At3g06240-like n=1 Tax=Impatiens glandulifera TaxID=253017 RepID=UPI001FB07DCA|nr:F-box/kelch-repeat protein At3g06240-like [Impatiens glandulifera]